MSPSANARGIEQPCSTAGEFPCRHHVLLTRHPVWVELQLRPLSVPVMAGLLTRGSTLARTFPSLKLSGFAGVAHRSQLRGQLRFRRALLALPYSLFIPDAAAAAGNHRHNLWPKSHAGSSCYPACRSGPSRRARSISRLRFSSGLVISRAMTTMRDCRSSFGQSRRGTGGSKRCCTP